MWIDTPTSFPAAPRIVVIGDVHGDVGRLLQILYSANIVNRNMQWIAEPKNTFVVQLGDQVDSIDRAVTTTSPWEKVPDVEVIDLMDQLDNIAKPYGGRVLSLLGNHEWMNVMGDFSYVSEHSKKTTVSRAQHFAPNGKYSTILSKRVVVLRIGDILFCHGGLLPHHMDAVKNNMHSINDVSRKYLRGLPLTQEELHILMEVIVGQNGITWTRSYMELLNEPDKLVEVINDVLTRTGTKCVCVGHNTVNDIFPIMGGALWFVDNGISRAYGRTSFQYLEILKNGELYQIKKIEST